MIKKIALIVLIVMGAIFAIRLLTPEDTWVCSQGQWIKHGNPSIPMPSSSCP